MYSKFYGLYRKPFENTPDPRFLFPSKSHREVLASLRYGVDNAKGFILISGDIGTGKTTMINALLEHIDPSYITFNIHNPKWTFAEIITYLAKKLKISVDGKNSFHIIDDLQAKLEKLDSLEKRVVLIIDEAHLLPESTLEDIRLLSNIEKRDRKLIQIVLVGQREIYQVLQKESLRTLKQRIVINRNLEPLEKKEISLYIRCRLRIAGRQSALFSDRAVALIRHRSLGVPRIINHICDNAMLIGYAKGVEKIGPTVIKEVIADMDSGMKTNNAAFSNYVKIFKWAGAIILLLSLFLIAKHFYTDQDFFRNVRSEEIKIPGARTQESIHREAVKSSRPVQNTNIQNSLPKSGANESKVHVTVEDQPAQMTVEAQPSESIASLSVDISTPPSQQELETPSGEPFEAPLPNPVKNSKAMDATKEYPTQRIVQPNDNLTQIAKDTYGMSNNTILDFIQMANPGIKDINRIFVGQNINLPKLKRDDLIYFGKNGHYHIHYASFYDSNVAERCLKEFGDQKQNVFILHTYQQETEVYRVYYGRFKNSHDAQKDLNALELKYLNF